MPHTINPSINPKVPYDPVKDFSPVSLTSVSPIFLFVHPSFEAKSVKELIALAKLSRTSLPSPLAATARQHTSSLLLQASAGIKLTHVPY
jgi:tripartite-type tricarboxylate transporter receptor subunit TctC